MLVSDNAPKEGDKTSYVVEECLRMFLCETNTSLKHFNASDVDAAISTRRKKIICEHFTFCLN